MVVFNEIFRFSQRPRSAAPKWKCGTCIFLFPLSLLKISLTFSRVVQVIRVFRKLISFPPSSCDLRVTACSHQESQERRHSLIGCRQESACPSGAAGVYSVCLWEELFKCKSLSRPKSNISSSFFLASVCLQVEPQSGVELSPAIGCCCCSSA